MSKKPYNGESDAEDILERVLKRKRYNSTTRDALAFVLEAVVAREQAAIRRKLTRLTDGWPKS